MITLGALRLTHPTTELPLVESADLELGVGQVAVIAASAGAGSTRLMSTIVGDLTPAAGFSRVLDCDPHRLRSSALRRLRRRIGIMPQTLSLVTGWSVLRQVALVLEVDGIVGAAAKYAATAALERVSLLDDAERDPATLTSSARGRIGLARALVRCPDVLMLDQPTANQDDTGVGIVAAAIADAAARGATCLVFSRDPRFGMEALRRGFRRLVLHDGQLVPHESLEIDIGSALELILDSSTAPIARPRRAVPPPFAVAESDAVAEAVPKVLPFPITARTAGAS